MAKKQSWMVWQKQAKFDLQIANISMQNGFYEWSCYQSNQSVEKILKALIVHQGFLPPRTHKLGILVGVANHASKAFTNVKFDFRKLESFTYITRYPYTLPNRIESPHELIRKDDAEIVVAMAKDIIHKVNKFLESASENPTAISLYTEDYYFEVSSVQNRIDKIVDQILSSPKFDVDQILLYGSFARDFAQSKTRTMDLLIVAETELRFIERIQYIRELTRGGEPIIEPLVYTPSEYNQLLYEEGEGYLENAIKEGRMIWKKERE